MFRMWIVPLVFTGLLLQGEVRSAAPELPALPPLNQPASEETLRGKFVWADFFTSDIDTARRFYGELFGWEWEWVVNEPGRRYGMFYEDGMAMAGVAEKAAPEPERSYGRWVHYISVDDVAGRVADVQSRGGRTLLEYRDYPQRGEFAVVADPEGALFGLMDSSSGDPPDYQAETGEWIWMNLYARQARQAADFYAELFGYNTFAPDEESEVLDIVLARDGYSRAGVGQLGETSESRPTWLGYIRVADVASMVAAAQDLGGEALYGPEAELIGGDLAVIADPFGAPLGLLRWTFADEGAGE